MPKISIIANFYNSEKFIPKLVKSIQNQTFTDWEMIAVNDCSPARDSEILHQYAQSDPRIHVIDNKVNLGIAQAKKVGIDASTGDYVTFIDGDDWLEKDAFEVMYNIAATKGAEVVFIDSYRAFPFGYKRDIKVAIAPEDYNKTLSWDEFRDKYYIGVFGKHVFSVAYWGKLYEGGKLRNFDYEFAPKGEVYAEDLMFTAHLLPRYKSFYFSDYQGYNWKWGGASVGGKNRRVYNPATFFPIELKRYKKFCKLIATHHVPRGQYFLDVEFKNVVRTVIFGIDVAFIDDKPAAIKQINEILCDPTIQVIREIDKYDEKYLKDPYICAVRDNDAEMLYELGAAKYKSEWKKRLFRKIILWITNH